MGIEVYKELLFDIGIDVKKHAKMILVSNTLQLMGSIGVALAGYEICREIKEKK